MCLVKPNGLVIAEPVFEMAAPRGILLSAGWQWWVEIRQGGIPAGPGNEGMTDRDQPAHRQPRAVECQWTVRSVPSATPDVIEQATAGRSAWRWQVDADGPHTLGVHSFPRSRRVEVPSAAAVRQQRPRHNRPRTCTEGDTSPATPQSLCPGRHCECTTGRRRTRSDEMWASRQPLTPPIDVVRHGCRRPGREVAALVRVSRPGRAPPGTRRRRCRCPGWSTGASPGATGRPAPCRSASSRPCPSRFGSCSSGC